MNNEDRQMIYDALCQYVFNENKYDKTNHFAAEVHLEKAKKATDIVIEIQQNWEDIIH